MYLSKEKIREISCNHDGVIMIWVKKKPMFVKLAGRWREGVAIRLFFSSSFMYL